MVNKLSHVRHGVHPDRNEVTMFELSKKIADKPTVLYFDVVDCACMDGNTDLSLVEVVVSV